MSHLKHPPRASIIVLRFDLDNSPIFPLNFTGGVKSAKFGQIWHLRKLRRFQFQSKATYLKSKTYIGCTNDQPTSSPNLTQVAFLNSEN